MCPYLSLHNHELENITYGTCEPHRPTEQACELAGKLYSLNPELGKCKVVEPIGEVCRIQIQQPPALFAVVCNKMLCNESGGANGEGNLKVYTLDPRDGELKLKQRFSTVRNLEKGLGNIIRETIRNKFYFLFIKCQAINSPHAQSNEISQLLPISPQLTIQFGKGTRSKNVLNVNILLLDSISRAHFYRSLPKTISTFKQWGKNSSKSSAQCVWFRAVSSCSWSHKRSYPCTIYWSVSASKLWLRCCGNGRVVWSLQKGWLPDDVARGFVLQGDMGLDDGCWGGQQLGNPSEKAAKCVYWPHW